MATRLLSNLGLVKACDNFPYTAFAEECYKLYLPNDTEPHGYILPENVSRIPWTPEFHIDPNSLTVTLHHDSLSTDPSDLSTFCNAAFAQVVNTAIDRNIFTTIHGQHSEPFAIVGAPYPVHLERFAADIFGIISRGAHLTVYTHDPANGSMRIWVPRRSPTMFTYPNKLDTTVAGGVPAHQTPFENIVQEADEEASLPADLIHRDARSAGVLTYIEFSAEAAGGDDRLVAPNMVYVYDLLVGRDIVPTPKDGEVKDLELMSVEEVKSALRKGEFKTNSAVVMVDFFVRHGIVTPENDADYVEVVSRMHRRLPFPTSSARVT